MLNIAKLQSSPHHIVSIGSHHAIIQSILDFDYLCGKKAPSVNVIISGGRFFERYFFGSKEILIPVYPSLSHIPENKQDLQLFLNVSSSRRVLSTTEEILSFPQIEGGVIFAEDVPEKHALALDQLSKKTGKFVIGPASVGVLLPGTLKLGAIGGIDYRQIVHSDLLERGSVAVFSSSGGMTNELISVVAQKGLHISFALHFGGDRFPVFTPEEAFLCAEQDPQTKTILYFGELGGEDEYVLANLLQEKKVTKQVISYIAGTISDVFPTPPQFGHAKAMAAKPLETATAKRKALKEAGAVVPNSFSEFVACIEQVPKENFHPDSSKNHLLSAFHKRQKALFASSISHDHEGDVIILGEELTTFITDRSFAAIVGSLFLGKKNISIELEECIKFILKLLTDHGPYVSGAVNTMITARAGKDLVSSLSAGLLTIGPRFGGAINQAAEIWLEGVMAKKTPEKLVEEFSAKKKYISGIGHRKYRIDLPDPRVKALKEFTKDLSKKEFLSYALEVEKITVAKKGNLILNVDGAIAAILLDILSEKENLSHMELKKLVTIEFFNAFFVLSRSVGFIAHYLDQKRIDEGLFRLPEKMVVAIEETS